VSDFSDIARREKPLKLEPAPGGKSGALLATYEGGVRAIVKATKDRLPSGHRRQRGIPAALHPTREVAFYRAAQLLAELREEERPRMHDDDAHVALRDVGIEPNGLAHEVVDGGHRLDAGEPAARDEDGE